MVSINLPDLIGLLGVLLILIMYFLLQIGKIQSRGMTYSVGNLLGALCLLISLFFNWNLSAVLLECAWIAISVYGILRAMRLKTSHA